MAMIDGTVVNVALPTLQAVFQITATQVQWIVESYALFLAGVSSEVSTKLKQAIAFAFVD